MVINRVGCVSISPRANPDERDCLIDVPKPLQLALGARVRILQGPLQNYIGLLAALRAYERVLVLLKLLGGQQRVAPAQDAIRAIGRSEGWN